MRKLLLIAVTAALVAVPVGVQASTKFGSKITIAPAGPGTLSGRVKSLHRGCKRSRAIDVYAATTPPFVVTSVVTDSTGHWTASSGLIITGFQYFAHAGRVEIHHAVCRPATSKTITD